MNAQSSYHFNNTNALLLSWQYSQSARALQPSVKAGVFSLLEVTLSRWKPSRFFCHKNIRYYFLIYIFWLTTCASFLVFSNWKQNKISMMSWDWNRTSHGKAWNKTSRWKYLRHHLFFDLDRKSDVSLDSFDSTRIFGIIFHDYGMDQFVRNKETFFLLSGTLLIIYVDKMCNN